jgi:hypothetical protein
VNIFVQFSCQLFISSCPTDSDTSPCSLPSGRDSSICCYYRKSLFLQNSNICDRHCEIPPLDAILCQSIFSYNYTSLGQFDIKISVPRFLSVTFSHDVKIFLDVTSRILTDRYHGFRRSCCPHLLAKRIVYSTRESQ